MVIGLRGSWYGRIRIRKRVMGNEHEWGKCGCKVRTVVMGAGI